MPETVVTLFHSCLWDDCGECFGRVSDPFCATGELVCGCHCHAPPISC